MNLTSAPRVDGERRERRAPVARGPAVKAGAGIGVLTFLAYLPGLGDM
jgi:hypothetical protein